MAGPSPDRARQSYRHEAFLWHDATDFTATMVPFVEEGLELGEPTMVALVPEHTAWLRDALGPRAAQVDFVDMHALGRNPARIIPAWQRFLDERGGRGKPVRGIGEPVWPGRRPAELAECQLHEALLNVAVDPALPFWLVCPYDAEQLDATVVAEAYRSHPVAVEAGAYRGSAAYAGRAHVEALFGTELSAADGEVVTLPFAPASVRALRGGVRLELHRVGLDADRAGDLTDAVLRLAVATLQRGSADGSVRVWRTEDAVLCEVADGGRLADPLAGRRAPVADAHDALWVANQVCDLVQLRSTPRGTAVRLHTWR